MKRGDCGSSVQWWHVLAILIPACVTGTVCDANFHHWSALQVGDFIERSIASMDTTSVHRIANGFRKNEVDGWVLARLEDEDLRALGVQLRLDRVQILAFVDRSRSRECGKSALPFTSSQTAISKRSTRRLLETKNSSTTHSDAQKRLIDSLLEGYQIRATPTQTRGENTTVQIGINFYSIEEIKVGRSEAMLNVWFRSSWQDPRLQWDPDEYDGVTQITLPADPVSIEQSTIWTPDIELHNTNAGLGLASFSPKDAMVWSDGSVFWSRSGTLGITCNFEGLELFPYDTLGCTAKFGGWGRSGWDVDYVFLNDGFSLSDFDDDKFKEFSFKEVSVFRSIDYFPCCPTEPWPALHFSMTFNRASNYYERDFVIPLIFCVFLNFAVFCMDVQGGERLSFSITMLLTVVAMQLLVQDHIPISGTITWYSQLLIVSEFFVMLTMFETITVQIVYYKNYRFTQRLHWRFHACEKRLAKAFPSCFSKRKTNSKRWTLLQRSAKAMKLRNSIATAMLSKHHVRAVSQAEHISTTLMENATKQQPMRINIEMQHQLSKPLRDDGVASTSKSHHCHHKHHKHHKRHRHGNDGTSRSDCLEDKDHSGSSCGQGPAFDRDSLLNWAALRIQILFREKRIRALAKRRERRLHWLESHGLTQEQYYTARCIDSTAMIIFPLAFSISIMGLYLRT